MKSSGWRAGGGGGGGGGRQQNFIITWECQVLTFFSPSFVIV
jgi:hypothetical protein